MPPAPRLYCGSPPANFGCQHGNDAAREEWHRDSGSGVSYPGTAVENYSDQLLLMKDLNIENAAKKQLAIFKEFKEFAMRGNVLDLAVGVVIGGAFGKIVSSLVADVVMPPISKLTGSVNFANLFINLDPHKTLKDGSAVRTLAEARTAEVPVIAYGQFLTNVVDFVIVASAFF